MYSASYTGYYIINAADTYANLSAEELEFYTRQSESIVQYKLMLEKFNSKSKVRTTGEQVYDDNYGGAYINTDGNLVVLLVEPTSSNTNYMKGITNNNELITIDCEYPYNELINVIDTINANLEYLYQQNIIISSMYEDVYCNRVIINVIALSMEKESIIRNIIDSPCMKINNCTVYEKTDSIDLKGGDKINDLEGSSTIGFCGTTNDGYGFVIAGHAGDVIGERFYYSGTPIGEVTATAYESGSTADVAFVKKSSNVNTTNKIGVFKCHYRATGLSDFPVGAQISKLGATTGATSGTILSNHYTSYANDRYFLVQVKASYRAAVGDSGGPVYIVQGVVNGEVTCKLLGTHRGTSSVAFGEEGYYAIFSKLNCIEAELDVQVVMN